METPDHTIHAEESRYVVRVGKDEAGYVSEDAEHPGLWILEDVGGRSWAGASRGRRLRRSSQPGSLPKRQIGYD
ncbi:hypothetical protein Mpop_3830 [Methylorubrum populi BJ001]|jgi:hypothetical protein|uniref:Uncharacterized protein n=1 Tax=Methylorubrum populi (strain ATCC BAA-705 / NCIMB 13946 / BJ001) TaxID=441620 RepID=B1Z9J7_METPB|nr:hypothetical protein Mpop_3830 [Methylorubrum populi BJ001]